jgi:hypothetical protein
MTKMQASTQPSPEYFPPSSELQKLFAGEESELQKLLRAEHFIDRIHPEALAMRGKIEQAILLSKGMAYLETLLTDDFMKEFVGPLNGKASGFKTDKPYSIGEARAACIDALVMGIPLVGNHFNIIGGNMYVTRKGMTFLLQKHPGLTDLRIDVVGIPNIDGDTAVIEYEASWRICGIADRMTRQIAVRVNRGQGFDAMLGKGDRKIKAAIFARITGTTFTEEGEIDDATPPKPAKTASAAQALLDGMAAIQNANDIPPTESAPLAQEPPAPVPPAEASPATTPAPAAKPEPAKAKPKLGKGHADAQPTDDDLKDSRGQPPLL